MAKNFRFTTLRLPSLLTTTENIIPTTTGAATAWVYILPRVEGKLDGLLYVPTQQFLLLT